MPAKVGIVAGGGELAAHVITACREAGRDIFILALEDHAQAADLPEPANAWIRMGNAGAGIDILREAGVGEIVFAGRVDRPSISELRPDRWTAKVLAKMGWSLFGDDGALKTLVREIEREGFRVVAPESLTSGLLAREGVFGAIEPDEAAWSDITRGFDVVRALGTLDIGQAVVVQQDYVLGVEAAEGTDALIERCGPLCRDGLGGVIVKASKPGQERRVDLPTIGVRTVELAVQAGLRGIAVEAGGVLVMDSVSVTEAADLAGVFVVGVASSAGDLGSPAPQPSAG